MVTDLIAKGSYLLHLPIGYLRGVIMRKLLAHFAIAVLIVFTPARAQNFSNAIFFGDSNTDTGWFLYKPFLVGAGVPPPGFGNGKAPSGAGTFTTNPDPGWAQIFANKFGYAAIAADTPGTGGNNWAIGGARVVASYWNTWSTQKQLSAYLASTGGVADPNAIYTYWIGINDLQTNTAAFGIYPGNIVNPQNVAQINLLASQEVSQITQLKAAGARYILVPNIYDLGPAALAATNPTAIYDPVTTASRNLLSQLVWNGLAAQGVNFIPADISTLRNFIATNPAMFGITVTSIQTGACGNLNSYQCTATNLVTPNANKTYLYADGLTAPDGGGHLGGVAQQIQADYFYSLVVAPSQISFLAEAPLKTRSGVIGAINNQIPLSFGQTGGLFHGWASGDLSWLKMDSGSTGIPNDPGTPLATTAGFDYALTPNWLVGMAFSALTTKQSFSLGGNYKQDEFAASLYTAFRRTAFWGDAIVSWGSLRDTINRQIPLGITQQSNLATANGSNVSFAGEVGYDFSIPIVTSAPVVRLAYKALPMSAPILTHGPFAGVILQQVNVNGFTETNPVGAPTALSFGTQTRNSAVGVFGYQASMRCGVWEPYAKISWDHEFADLNRFVTASLTSVVAPSFTMPAVILGRDWATGTLGTRVRLAPNVSGYAALSAELGQSNAMVYSGQIGFNVAFDPPMVASK